MQVNSIFYPLAKEKAKELEKYFFYCSEEEQAKILKFLLKKTNDKVLSYLVGSDWLTATQIAEMLNTSKQKIGKLANNFGLKNDPNKCQSYIVQVSETKYSKVYFYHKSTLLFFRKCIEGEKKDKKGNKKPKKEECKNE